MNGIILKFSTLFFFWFIINSTLSAQVNSVSITSPESIAGDYACKQSEDFGSSVDGSLSGTGTFGLYDDDNTVGCASLTNDVSGMIVFLDRADCLYIDKARNAQEAGGVAVIICNHNEIAGTENDLTNMTGDAEDVEIPAVFLSYNSCQIIREEAINGTVEVTLQFVDFEFEPCDVEIEYDDNVIWGANGEGEFDGGLGDWEILCQGNSCWKWTLDPFIPGAYSNGRSMTSPSNCNGFVYMSSDFLDNNGVPGDFGLGDCPSPCFGSLLSPVIDFTGEEPEGLFIKFTQRYRHFQSNYSIVISYDEGASYPDTLFVNQTAVTNTSPSAETLQIPITSYTGQPTVRFKFDYNGDYYFWAIDDVTLIGDAYGDMQVNANWFAAAPQFRTPIDQVSEMPFMVDLFNNGNLNAENVQVTVDIEKDGDNVFTTTQDYGVVDAFASNENLILAETFTPEEIGDYVGTYTVTSDTEGNIEDNDQLSFNFIVTENLLGSIPNEGDDKQALRSVLSGSTWIEEGTAFTRNYGIARVFYIPNGSGKTISNVRFGLEEGDADASGFVNVYLLKVAQDNLPFNPDDASTSNIFGDETIVVGVNIEEILVLSGLNSRMNDVKMAAADGNGSPAVDDTGAIIPIELEDNSVYALVVSTAANDDEQIQILGSDYYSDTDEINQHSSGPINFAFETGDYDIVRTGTYITPLIDGGAAEVNSADFATWWGINELFVELTIENKDVGTNDINPNIGLSIYPNPSQEQIWIDVNLTSNSEKIKLELTNIDGKLLRSQTYFNTNNQKATMNVADLPTGIYTLTVRSDEGMIAKKVVVE